MKHITTTLAAILTLGLLAGCGETGNSSSETKAQVQTVTEEGSNSISYAQIDAQQKKKNNNKKKFIKLTAQPGIETVSLEWEVVKRAKEYLLKWGESRELLEDAISLDASQVQYLHEGLEPDTTYYYRIKAKFGKKKKKSVSRIVKVHTGDREKVKQSDVAY